MNSLYLHLPFCKRKCFYCSFIVVVAREGLIGEYLKSLMIEAEKYRNEPIETIYIGGGTPTRLKAEQLRKLMDAVYKNFDCRTVSEITIEANPEDITEEKLEAIKGCGIKRISLGVQTFHDKYLRELGRNHDAQSAVKAVELIHRHDFKSVNLDLMFGFKHQNLKELNKDLDQIFSLKPHHISLYGLTIEKNSRFFTQGKTVSNDLQAEMYRTILKRMAFRHFNQYEVSNFSKPRHESRHNRNYWEGKNYIGLGVGAHSHRNGKRWWNVSKIDDYIKRIKEGCSAEESREVLNDTERLKERILFGLRMNEGVSFSQLGISLEDTFDTDQLVKIHSYIREGLLRNDKGGFKATEKGRLLLDEISAQLI